MRIGILGDIHSNLEALQSTISAMQSEAVDHWVQVGDIVVTSGIDGIYPKGFLIGVVEVAQRGSSFYRTIHVRPQVKFSDLEDVLVIIPDPVTSTTAAGGE